MSRYFSQKYAQLVPYTPGEQPRDMRYVKLNTNESPFPPSPMAQALARQAAGDLNLYSDPECRELVQLAAQKLAVEPEEILFTNGSDEILNFAFMAYCDQDHPAVFPDITYGFYPVFAKINNIPYEQIPLQEDFTVRVEDYIGLNKTIFIANPNAPTGIALPLQEIERIVAGNPDSIVVIDEAYVDFGAESAISLIRKYENLLVTQTFSKSRSMAGARLGFGVGNAKLIQDLNTVKYSTNPYNINRMTMAAGIGALADEAYFQKNCRAIMETRAWTMDMLRKRNFIVPDSMTNFVFAKHARVDGKIVYQKLRQRGILVRHFDSPKLTDYNRITIGSPEQMQVFINAVDEILEDTP